ncbi:tetratricopeptide repeat protein [Candidatus Dependentiae bacterium]|nr:tetratricopeptide repeat protein [Candidatus Dependentiae bacterium]
MVFSALFTLSQDHLAYIRNIRECGDYKKAITLYKKLLDSQSYRTAAHIGLAQTYLTLGNFEKGWRELEWHLGKPWKSTQDFKRYITNHARLNNKIILLRAEWGIGDSIWMLRYAQLLKKRGAYIIFAPIHNALIPLLKQQPYINEIIPPGALLPSFHFQAPILI